MLCIHHHSLSLYTCRAFLETGNTQESQLQNYNANKQFMRTIGNITEFSDPPFPSYYNLDALWYPGTKAPAVLAALNLQKNNSTLDRYYNEHTSRVIAGRYSPYKSTWRPWYNNASQQEMELLPHTHTHYYLLSFMP
jgi:hypothetical protein